MSILDSLPYAPGAGKAIAMGTSIFAAAASYLAIANPLMGGETVTKDLEGTFPIAGFVLVAALFRSLLQLTSVGRDRIWFSTGFFGATVIVWLLFTTWLNFELPALAVAAVFIFAGGTIFQDLLSLEPANNPAEA